MTVAGQTPVTYTHDANARLRTITQAPLNPVALDYDAANRRALLTLPNGVSTEYQYDGASRLAALIYRNALGPLGDLQYTYDPAGNRVSVGGTFARALVPEAVPSATYDAGNRQLAFGSSTMAFDDTGNRLTQTDPSGTLTYTWDARNRLTALSGPSVSASFAYDGLGRRAQKTIGSTSTVFRYDGLDLVTETSGGSEVAYLRTLGIDEALVRTDAVDTAQYLAEALGSSVALSTPAGSIATTYTFEPFGRTEVAGTPTANAFQFTGRENDGTGLYYYRARYYDPMRGRFISSDPLNYGLLKVGLTRFWDDPVVRTVGRQLLRNPDSHHGYTYATGNPLSATDPLGLMPPGLIGIKDALSAVPFPEGPGSMIGGLAAGAVVGALATTLGAPVTVAATLGVAAGVVGGMAGSRLDHICAGELNCREAEWLRLRDIDRDLAPIRRDLEEAQRLLDKLHRITDAMLEITSGRK